MFLSVLLAFMNTFGALFLMAIAVPMMWLLKARSQLLFAAIITLYVITYPLTRATEVFPAQEVVDFFAELSPDRASSLGFRFFNEDMLLEKAMERPYFGWGFFARNHVWTPDGQNISVIDGAWIGIFGRGGAGEFITFFGLLLVPVYQALFRIRRVSEQNRPLLAGIGMIAAILAVDLVPNGLFNGIPVFLAGALAGLAQGMATEQTRARPNERVARAIATVLLWRRLRSASRAQAELSP
jgi:hypothetical protein